MCADQLDLFAGTGEASLPIEEPSRCGLLPGIPNPPRLLLGCCAWKYDCLTDHFYPRNLAANHQLPYYARYCNAVEVDSTFYRVPTAANIDRWVSETPSHFRFSIKAPRSLTEDAVLDLAEPPGRVDWEALLSRLHHFRGKLSALVLQLRPSCTIYCEDKLFKVLDTIPKGVPTVVEFRHPTWNREHIHAILRERNVVRAWVDQYHDPTRGVKEDAPFLFAETGSFRYIRLLGNTAYKIDPTTREPIFKYTPDLLFDRSSDLPRWCERIAAQLAKGAMVHVACGNHYEGFSIKTVDRIRTALLQ